MMEFYSDSKHRSRKKRFCEMCGGVINVGDFYYSESGRYDGEFFKRDLHIHCDNMESEFYNKENIEM